MRDIACLTSEERSDVIETRKPLGLFYGKDEGHYIGIDNARGDAWVEEFNTKRSCFKWLRGCAVKDAHGVWHNK